MHHDLIIESSSNSLKVLKAEMPSKVSLDKMGEKKFQTTQKLIFSGKYNIRNKEKSKKMYSFIDENYINK
jgi:hypothetical protein